MEPEQERLQELVEELDTLVPREGALVRMVQYGGGPDESRMEGTRRGYQRLGIELLRGAVGPERDADEPSITVDLAEVLHPDSDIGFDEFLLVDESGQAEPAAPKLDLGGWAWMIGCVGTLLLLATAAVVGLVTMAGWLLSRLAGR
jgi:hypothetical protein